MPMQNSREVHGYRNDRKMLSVSYHNKLVSTIDIGEFEKISITIGRAADNDIILHSSIVSNYHAIIDLDDNLCILTDCGSTNGIFVNGIRIHTCQLNNGDTLRIDDTNNPHHEGILLVYSVIQEDNDEKWVEYPLSVKDTVTIGRISSNDITLDHQTISRQHAKIKHCDDKFVIEDLRSTNGTFVNSERISSSYTLTENDIIFIGNTKIIYYKEKLLYTVLSKGVRLDAIRISKTIQEKGNFFHTSTTKKLLNDISISVKPGELVALIGGSGAGKSTLMDTLNGFRKSTSGMVLVNNDDFYANYNAYKNILGYVPQQDTVYDLLTVEQMLLYAARLRMPKDTTYIEIKQRVASVINEVELETKEHLVIKLLSGGQKKRVSIAVELLADPKLFFLDEPTSGLDPGMERNMMQLLKKLSNVGKTIILITHAMPNLHLCDKVTFLGNGGRLCYFGPPSGALEFFGVNGYVDIYDLITNDSEKWEQEFKNSNYYIYNKTLEKKIAKKQEHNQHNSHNALRQFFILTTRYLKLTVIDIQRFIFLLLQAPLIAFLLGVVSQSSAFKVYEGTNQIIFTLASSAVWIGVLNSIQEIVKEKAIYRRERAVNLQLLPYIMSKISVLGLICVIQSILLVSVFNFMNPLPLPSSLVGNLYFELVVTTFLLSLASTGMGLAVSTLVENPDRAMGLAPLLLIPQIMFSGFIFRLHGIADSLSYLAVTKWGIRAYAVSLDINKLPSTFTLENPQLLLPSREGVAFYNHELIQLYHNWGILLVFLGITIVVSILSLRMKDS